MQSHDDLDAETHQETHDEIEARLVAAGSRHADPPRRRSALALVLPGAAIWALILLIYRVLR